MLEAPLPTIVVSQAKSSWTAPLPVTPADRMAVPPPAKAAEPTPPTNAATMDDSWQGQLAVWLATHKSYPEAARRVGEEGSPSIRFVVARDGRVLSVELARSSGSKALDDAAVALLQGARVPPFPSTMQQETATVTVSLRYSLKRTAY